jgi:hypothetical protein
LTLIQPSGELGVKAFAYPSETSSTATIITAAPPGHRSRRAKGAAYERALDMNEKRNELELGIARSPLGIFT